MFWAGNVNDDGIYRIPFDVSVDPFYSESNMRYLEQIARDVARGQAHFAEHELMEVEE